MTSVSLLYNLPLYLILVLLVYEYLFKYIISGCSAATIFRVSEYKMATNFIFLSHSLKFTIALFSYYILTQKYLLTLPINTAVLIIFIYLNITLWGIILYKDFYLSLTQQNNLIFISLSFYIITFLIYILIIIENLIIFMLFLEIIAVFYYFFFLNYLDTLTFSLIKYKNFLVLYLLSSFLTTICFNLGLSFIATQLGTVSFKEIMCFTVDLKIGVLLILISLFWKLGIPGMHFFKLELYNYLPITLLFFFSINSLILNIFLIFLFYIIFKATLLYYSSVFLIFILVISCLLISRGFSSITGYQLIAYSALITLTILLLTLNLLDDLILFNN